GGVRWGASTAPALTSRSRMASSRAGSRPVTSDNPSTSVLPSMRERTKPSWGPSLRARTSHCREGLGVHAFTGFRSPGRRVSGAPGADLRDLLLGVHLVADELKARGQL